MQHVADPVPLGGTVTPIARAQDTASTGDQEIVDDHGMISTNAVTLR
ncbi:hypothetical protein V5F77_11950 [Xanthobacter sp. DSM 24535]